MRLVEITDDIAWDRSPLLFEKGIFLQSSSQKKLYEKLGQKTWLLQGMHEGMEIRSLVTKIIARRGTFLFLPYGPLMTNDDPKLFSEFMMALQDLGKKEHAAWIRISPFWQDNKEKRTWLKNIGARLSPLHILAESLWILPLRDPEQLLALMDKKHRYLIRRAEKDGVRVIARTSKEEFQRFLSLHHKTVERHHFTPYKDTYFEAQVEFFAEKNEVLIFEAFFGDEVLASAIVMYFGKWAAYHHGASSSDPKHRKIPASYLLQWEAIREGIKRSCTHYNFWGIAPEKNQNHPFSGITHFKTGFGGHALELVPGHDLIISKKYWLNFAIESVRKWKRGF